MRSILPAWRANSKRRQGEQLVWWAAWLGPYRTCGAPSTGKEFNFELMRLPRLRSLHASLEVRRAKAQLCQNFRAKYQASLDGGSWAQAWLLTGVEDPCSRCRWAAPQWQISAAAAAANYIKATSDLQRQSGVNAGPSFSGQKASGPTVEDEIDAGLDPADPGAPTQQGRARRARISE